MANGLSAPIFMTHAPGDRGRLFIAERGSPADSSNATANIRILNLETGMLEATPFATITGINNGGEGGVLGMAFHPDFNGEEGDKFYLYVTANDSIAGTPFSSYIRQYTLSANPNVANPGFTPVMTWSQPQSNHNGGWIGFSPNDNYLYVMAGDGGNGNDQGTGHTEPGGNAQDLTSNFLGKVLRIDVDGDDFPADPQRNYAIPFDSDRGPGNPFAPDSPGGTNPTGDDEIWSFGLRNPFRASFDRATGDLWIGDVGQGVREEIDFQPASSAGGENYGWRLREGAVQTPGVGGPVPPGYVPPVYDYNRDNDPLGGTVVTGGYRYRGPDPSLQGLYFFGDSRNSFQTSDDNFWTIDPSAANVYASVQNIDSQLTFNTGSPGFFASFGEDAVGNLYFSYIGTGDVYRMVTDEFTPGDFDGDADVDGDDLAIWQAGFGTESGALRTDGDADSDGDVDGDDFLAWQQNLGWSALNVPPPETASVPEPASGALAIGLLGMAAVGVRRRGRCPTRG